MPIQKSITEQISLSASDKKTETLQEKFGETFQTNVFKGFITDLKFWKKMHGKLTPELFSKFHSRIFKLMDSYFGKYDNLPSKEILTNLVEEQKDLVEGIKEPIYNIISEIYNITDQVNHLQYYKDAIKDFIIDKSVYEAFMDSMDLFNAGKYKEISEKMSDAVKEVDIDENLGLDFLNCSDIIDNQLSTQTIETPFVGINEILSGGLGRKELGLILGGTGAGKSWIMQTIASHALLKDFNVLYYTLEMSDVAVAKRFVSILEEKETSLVTGEDIVNIKSTLKQKGLSSRLFIVEYPTGSADITTLRNNISALYNYFSFKPDLICVDYADLMKPKTVRSEKRHELSSIYEDLRRMGGELDVGVWSISQVNRSGYDKRILTVDNIAEDFNKATICDFIMSAGRNIQDRQGGAAQVFVAKNRRGKDALLFDMDMDFSKGKITLGGDAEEVLDTKKFKEKRPSIDDDEIIDDLLSNLN